MSNMLSPLCCPRILTAQGPVACVQDRCAWWVSRGVFSGCAETVQAQAGVDALSVLYSINEVLGTQESEEGL